MALTDLKAHTLRYDAVGDHHIKLILLDGVGYEVRWWRSYGALGVVPPLRPMHLKLAEAETAYDQILREIVIAEAAIALGIEEED